MRTLPVRRTNPNPWVDRFRKKENLQRTLFRGRGDGKFEGPRAQKRRRGRRDSVPRETLIRVVSLVSPPFYTITPSQGLTDPASDERRS